MFDIQPAHFVMVMATCLFLLGTVSIAAGIYVLFSKVVGGELKAIAHQTTRLAQKGVAEDVAGLVGNASALIQALESLVKTATGVGITLIILGTVMMAGSYYLLLQVVQFK